MFEMAPMEWNGPQSTTFRAIGFSQEKSTKLYAFLNFRPRTCYIISRLIKKYLDLVNKSNLKKYLFTGRFLEQKLTGKIKKITVGKCWETLIRKRTTDW